MNTNRHTSAAVFEWFVPNKSSFSSKDWSDFVRELRDNPGGIAGCVKSLVWRASFEVASETRDAVFVGTDDESAMDVVEYLRSRFAAEIASLPLEVTT